MDVPIETPTAAGIEQALEVARRWLPLVDGRIARFEEYADSRAAEALFAEE
ncbi:hypothetical protein [Nocardioides daphniae]|uniref:GNAT family N-acetyltransferase n=1 Tax=Nocardioides daphniae TaxID=402297 RepID=A0ABQ1Q4S2_9ACTN|nr:hypothetical protein [Nocardioides daphniae]GGD12069.1 hypothetical protein GCM10007231_08740 [Nocardioides daphniae]